MEREKLTINAGVKLLKDRGETICNETIKKACIERKIPYKKENGRYYFLKSALLAWFYAIPTCNYKKAKELQSTW
jgi:hypothetical protein